MKIETGYGIERRLWFTSDTHFAHSNICRATTNWTGADNVTRDFKSLDHMNDTLVNNINEVVGEDDILIHLGDWSFGGFENIELFRNRINCKNVHLVFGNHDHHIRRDREGIQSLFSSTQDYLMIDLRVHKPGKIVDRHTLICMHYPLISWDGMNDGTVHLFGHVHLPKELRLLEGKAMDVGVDGNKYYPIEITEVLNIVKNQPIKRSTIPRDHHEKRIA
jgi:calcineurin-like phosphoesterase family protein